MRIHEAFSAGCEKNRLCTMHGLRVYKKGDAAEICGGLPVFYSQREDGPYYRWSYDNGSNAWQASRVLRSGVSPKTLTAMTWKGIPARLQRSIVEHYED